MPLTKRDRQRLEGVHPDLVRLVEAVGEQESIVVLEGLRTIERQRELLRQRATTTLRSRHLTGHAVDFAPRIGGTVSWHWPHFHHLAATVKVIAADLRIPVEWGGDWQSFKDGPHWQLPWALYPEAQAHDHVRGPLIRSAA